MITVHHLENSRSQRVLWLLEELELPYEVKHYARDPDTLFAPPELTAMHPLGKSPVITDGDVTVAESGAIAEYLLDTYGRGRFKPPSGTPAYREYTYWLHFAEGSAMPMLLLKLVFDKLRHAPMPFFVKPVARAMANRVEQSFVTPNLERQLAFVEAELANREWFAGDDFTAADILMSFPLEVANTRAGLGRRYPNILDWLLRIHIRPAYQRALTRGGRYRVLD